METLAAINIMKQTRQLLYYAVKDLSEEQLLAIPDGFDNNITWNIGHIIATHKGLCYRPCALDMALPRRMFPMYSPGTSPADWKAQPDIPALLEMLMQHPQQMEDDYAAGKFDGPFEEVKSTTTIHLRNIQEATSFNNFHEGLHMGAILALINFVVSEKE
jgi:hypothetical protein